MHRHKHQLSAASLVWPLVVILLWANLLCAQTTSFTYQGRLTDGGNAANGSYDLQFALFDGSSGGTQIGSTLTRSAVAVSGGVFSVQLDFGVTAFPGADRFLEIGVRLNGGGTFTVLSPRQQISSTPYAIRTLRASQADALSNACVACVQDSQINSVAGSKVSGSIPLASVPSGSTSYIQNTSSPQSSANFNIGGNGTLGGNLLTGGRIGVGPLSPLHRLGISGGPAWTGDFWGGAIDLENASAIGWRGNSSGFRFGIGHTNAGLAFFRTSNDLGTTGVVPSYDFLINNAGNVGIGSPSLAPSLTSKVEIFAQDGLGINGFQPFLSLRDTNASSKTGFIQGVNGDLVLLTNSRAAMVLKDVTGNVGIGTATPNNAKLQVESGDGPLTAIIGNSGGGFGVRGHSQGQYGVYGSSVSSVGVFGYSDSAQGLYGESNSGVGVFALSFSGNLVEGANASGNRQFHISNNGTYVAGSDFAEALPAIGNKAGYEPGDVLVASTKAPGHVEKASRPYDARVAGIYSTRPGMLGADKQGISRVDADEVPVAIVGIVPTKVSTINGPIRVGDLLTTSSTPGYAMRCDNRLKCIGAMVGKAMEPLKNGKGIIKVLVTLR